MKNKVDNLQFRQQTQDHNVTQGEYPWSALGLALGTCAVREE